MNQTLATRRLWHHRLISPSSVWGDVRRGLRVLLVFLFLAAFVPSDGYVGPAAADLTIGRAIGRQGFRLAAWEVAAWRQTIEGAITRPGAALSAAQQHDLVTGYFDRAGRIGDLAGQIEAIYAGAGKDETKTEALRLQAELDGLRARQATERPAVEEILQAQVGQVLAENGLVSGRLIFPPVLFHFSESPDVLILSPRNRIVLERSVYLQPGAPVGEKEQIEGQVEQGLGASALVDGTGGFSTYPTMVVEVADLEWVLSTISHEWFHTYLAFRPLGWHYFDNGDTRTLNETAATIFGDELGSQVLARFYPERVPPPPPPAAAGGQQAAPKFSFGATMRETRLHVDDLLAQGKIDEAESYMEAQRQLIVRHGYVLRKLNQAYFAFHGSYAVGPAATDPIGDKLRSLRAASGSLLHFVQLVSRITTVQELNAELATLGR